MMDEQIWNGRTGSIRSVKATCTSEPLCLRPRHDMVLATPVSDHESDYSTDLEDDFEPPRRKSALPDQYLDYCFIYGVPPARCFIRQINAETVDLRHYNVGPNGIKPICDTLARCYSTFNLYLHDNGLGASGGQTLAALFNVKDNLERIDLSCNKLKESLRCIGTSLLASQDLEALNVNWNFATDKDIETIIDVVKDTTRMKSLSMNRNLLTDASAGGFRDALTANLSLKHLDVSDNQFGTEFAMAISKPLVTSRSLSVLNLSDNGIGDEGAKLLGQSLMVNSSLKELDISRNRITQRGAVDFSKGLEENAVLMKLRIGNNALQGEGACAIVGVFTKNTDSQLTEIYMNSVTVDLTFEAFVVKVLALVPTLYIEYGGVLRGGKPKAAGKPQKDLVVRLIEYLDLRGLRVKDFYDSMAAGSPSEGVDKDTFRQALIIAGLPVVEHQFRAFFKILADDSTQRLTYQGLNQITQATVQNKFLQKRNNGSDDDS